MMDISLYFSRFFANPFLNSYTYAAVLLLTLILVKNKFTTEAGNILYVLNTLAGTVSLLGLLYWAIELWLAWYGQNPYELYAFVAGDFLHPVYPVLLYFFLRLPSIAGLFFLNKKFRLRIWFVLIFLLVLNAGALYHWFLQFNRDYLPSSWAVSTETFWEKAVKWTLTPLVLIFTYWLLHKRNKLPYPSIFFKRNVQSC